MTNFQLTIFHDFWKIHNLFNSLKHALLMLFRCSTSIEMGFTCKSQKLNEILIIWQNWDFVSCNLLNFWDRGLIFPDPQTPFVILRQLYWTILDKTGLYWNLPDYTGLYWNYRTILELPDYTGLYSNILDYIRLYWNILDYTGLCRTILDFTGVYRTILKFTRLYWTIMD